MVMWENRECLQLEKYISVLVYGLCSNSWRPWCKEDAGLSQWEQCEGGKGASGGPDCPSPAVCTADFNQQTHCCSLQVAPNNINNYGLDSHQGSFHGRIFSPDTAMSWSSHNWASVPQKTLYGPLGLEAALKPDLLAEFLTMWWITVNSSPPCLVLGLCFDPRGHWRHCHLHSCSLPLLVRVDPSGRLDLPPLALCPLLAFPPFPHVLPFLRQHRVFIREVRSHLFCHCVLSIWCLVLF